MLCIQHKFVLFFVTGNVSRWCNIVLEQLLFYFYMRKNIHCILNTNKCVWTKGIFVMFSVTIFYTSFLVFLGNGNRIPRKKKEKNMSRA